ncbi:MAG: hypothetical protein Q9166_005433 [cf. Caloplaca sp. 2 TL-2023]
MEKPVPAQVSPPPLTILHHDEHLMFPGYDVMVGEGCIRQDEEEGRMPWTARNDEGEAVPPAQGQSSVGVNWYKKHKRKLVVAAIICYQLETQGSTVCGGGESLQGNLNHARLLQAGAFACFNHTNGRAVLNSGVYGAAAGDLSPILSAGLCDGSQNITTPEYDMALRTEARHQMRASTRVPPALTPGATQRLATRLTILVPLVDPQEKCLEAQRYRSLTDVQLVVHGTTGKAHRDGLIG